MARSGLSKTTVQRPLPKAKRTFNARGRSSNDQIDDLVRNIKRLVPTDLLDRMDLTKLIEVDDDAE